MQTEETITIRGRRYTVVTHESPTSHEKAGRRRLAAYLRARNVVDHYTVRVKGGRCAPVYRFANGTIR